MLKIIRSPVLSNGHLTKVIVSASGHYSNTSALGFCNVNVQFSSTSLFSHGINVSHNNLDVDVKRFHTNSRSCRKKEPGVLEKSIIRFDGFDHIDQKNRNTFLQMVNMFNAKFPNRKGHVDFILTALKHMEEFGVHEDIEAYRALIDVMPKGKFLCTNAILGELMYFPRQQDCILDLLNQMEHYGICPDVDMGELLLSIFGLWSHPYKKYCRMLYWMPKFKNLSPWLLPRKLPDDSLELAKMAIQRITSVDLQTKVDVLKTETVLDSIDKTWIVSGQSPRQIKLLEKHPKGAPVIVEGGDRVYLRKKSVSYFILKADKDPPPDGPPPDKSDVSKLQFPFFNPEYKELQVAEEPCVHVQDYEIIYAVCATGTSSKDSLLSWVRILQKTTNPVLGELPILFRFKSPSTLPAHVKSEVVVHGQKA